MDCDLPPQATELPHFLPLLLPRLTDERSSARALTLRAIARLEPPLLAAHAETVST